MATREKVDEAKPDLVRMPNHEPGGTRGERDRRQALGSRPMRLVELEVPYRSGRKSRRLRRNAWVPA